MRPLKAFNFKKWIDDNRHLLKPPVGNKCVFEDAEFIIMVVGGPNARKDYHYEEGEEFFYQLEGDMILHVMADGKPVAVPIKEGEIFLLPPRVRHNPQRMKNTVGVVIERKRRPGEKDGLSWFCEKCANLLYEEYFELKNVETQFQGVFKKFYSNLDFRTCKKCKTVMEPPPETPRELL